MIYPLIAAPSEVLGAAPVMYSAAACHDQVNSAR